MKERSSVIKVWFDSGETFRARALSGRALMSEIREARKAAVARLTRQSLANDNDPAPRWGHWRDRDEDEAAGAIRSPALRQRMVLKGRLAEFAGRPAACIKRGTLVNAPRPELTPIRRL